MSSPISGLEPQESSVNPIGLIALLVVSVIGGVVVGGLLFASSKLVYLIFMSPLIAALISGKVSDFASSLFSIRSSLIIFIAGAIIGLTAYGVYRYAEYWDFVREVTSEELSLAEEQGYKVTESEVHEWIDLFLEEEFGNPGFVGFVQMQAEEGLSISSTRSSFNSNREGTNVGKELTLGYWVLEIIVMSIGAGLFALSKDDDEVDEAQYTE